ncbi:hypothetical protein KUTeg_018961 [Tegillarca granosa]|uniref:CUB domain-containing protein n=1 Tax=Tegillarca granosa TaxID=220873 RepID=A0ABQ9EGK8_TEGGR|nr:hypothetical protein KUTeg_018961 [Tegillarca granosa]
MQITKNNNYMDQRCGQTLEFTNSIRLKLTQFSKYNNNMNCFLKIKAPENRKIMIVFNKVDIENGFFGLCNDDYLQIANGPSINDGTIPGLRSKMCGEERPRGAYLASSNYISLKFVSDWHDRDDGFEILLTSFGEGTCQSSEFKCEAGQCISSSLKCDGYNHCGDYSDECGIPAGVIAGIAVTVIVIIAIACLIVFCVCRRRRQQGYVKRTSTPSTTVTTGNVSTYPAYPQQPMYPQQPAYPQQPPQSVAYNAQPMSPPPYDAVATNPYPYGAPQQ